MFDIQIKFCTNFDCKWGGHRPWLIDVEDLAFEDANYCGCCGCEVATFERADNQLKYTESTKSELRRRRTMSDTDMSLARESNVWPPASPPGTPSIDDSWGHTGDNDDSHRNDKDSRGVTEDKDNHGNTEDNEFLSKEGRNADWKEPSYNHEDNHSSGSYQATEYCEYGWNPGPNGYCQCDLGDSDKEDHEADDVDGDHEARKFCEHNFYLDECAECRIRKVDEAGQNYGNTCKNSYYGCDGELYLCDPCEAQLSKCPNTNHESYATNADHGDNWDDWHGTTHKSNTTVPIREARRPQSPPTFTDAWNNFAVRITPSDAEFTRTITKGDRVTHRTNASIFTGAGMLDLELPQTRSPPTRSDITDNYNQFTTPSTTPTPASTATKTKPSARPKRWICEVAERSARHGKTSKKANKPVVPERLIDFEETAADEELRRARQLGWEEPVRPLWEW